MEKPKVYAIGFDAEVLRPAFAGLDTANVRSLQMNEVGISQLYSPDSRWLVHYSARKIFIDRAIEIDDILASDQVLPWRGALLSWNYLPEYEALSNESYFYFQCYDATGQVDPWRLTGLISCTQFSEWMLRLNIGNVPDGYTYEYRTKCEGVPGLYPFTASDLEHLCRCQHCRQQVGYIVDHDFFHLEEELLVAVEDHLVRITADLEDD